MCFHKCILKDIKKNMDWFKNQITIQFRFAAFWIFIYNPLARLINIFNIHIWISLFKLCHWLHQRFVITITLHESHARCFCPFFISCLQLLFWVRIKCMMVIFGFHHQINGFQCESVYQQFIWRFNWNIYD